MPPIVITPEPVSPRPWSCASRVTSASSTNVPAGEASKASIDWLVTPTASSAAAAEISGAGWRCATVSWVAEADAAVEDGRDVFEDLLERRAVLGQRVEGGAAVASSAG